MTKQYRQPTDEEIAVQAYYLWESEGRQNGRDREHWQRAREILCAQCQNEPTAQTPTKAAPERRPEMKTTTKRQTTMRAPAFS
jgi:hypothetical protein